MKTKKNATLFILFLLTVLFSQPVLSQENFIPGKILTLENDTLTGFVDYRNWNVNPEKIYFTNRKDGEKQLFKPENIAGFSVKDEIYRSAFVLLETSASKLEDLSYDPSVNTVSVNLFLQTIFEGEKSLYLYKDKSEKESFYFKEGSKYSLLIYKKYLKETGGRVIENENNKYLGQLKVYLQDCVDISSKLENTEYNKRSLEQLFNYYFNSTHSNLAFEKKVEKMVSKFGVLAGLSASTLSFEGRLADFIDKTNYKTSIDFTAGIYYTLVLPRGMGKWAVNNELLFYNYKAKGSYTNFINTNSYSIYNPEIEISYFRLNNMVRYKHSVGDIFVFFNLGISNGIIISENDKLIKEIKSYQIETIVESKLLESVRKLESGFNIGLGAEFKKYSIEIRYEHGNGMSDYWDLNSPVNKFFFLFGYQL